MADEPQEKPAGDQPAEPARETAVGHPVVEADAAGTPAEAPADAGSTEVFFSREEPEPEPQEQPAAAPPTPAWAAGTSPAEADREAADAHDKFEERPELLVAGAFVGAFVFGKLLKKLTGSDD